MLAAEDTEITIGTGKMLALFFGLVALRAVFFGFGFSLGRSSVKTSVAADSLPLAAATGVRPSAVKSANAPASAASPELTFYKAVEQKDSNAQLATNESTSAASTTDTPKAAPDPAAPPPMNGYYVQVAAVSKQEDAQALVEALRKKQYSAFASTAAGDKLFHVQLGPFADVKEAESVRGKLVSDGYNPILKK